MNTCFWWRNTVKRKWRFCLRGLKLFLPLTLNRGCFWRKMLAKKNQIGIQYCLNCSQEFIKWPKQKKINKKNKLTESKYFGFLGAKRCFVGFLFRNSKYLALFTELLLAMKNSHTSFDKYHITLHIWFFHMFYFNDI